MSDKMNFTYAYIKKHQYKFGATLLLVLQIDEVTMKSNIIVLVLILNSCAFARNLHEGAHHKYTPYIKHANGVFGKHDFSKAFEKPKEKLQLVEDDVTIVLYTQNQTDGIEIRLSDAANIAKASPFNLRLRTYVVVHGWLDSIASECSISIKDALLKVADVNVLVVNWDACSRNINYFVSKWCVPDVGQYLGDFLVALSEFNSYSLSDVTVVGHSLGAHIAGCTGKRTNGSLGAIVALDPAGPFFFTFDKQEERLLPGDAKYVQAVHTNAIFLGVNYQIGDADFWPNGGYNQNGCEWIIVTCSHNNAYRYYVESLLNNQFVARKCDSYEDYENGKCNENPKAMLGGLDIDSTVVGNYYLDTNPQSPYGQGDTI